MFLRFNTLICCLFVFVVAVDASNLGFLVNQPLASFSIADNARYKQAVFEALNTLKDGETTHWQTDDGKVKGEITLIKTLNRTRDYCRQVRLVNAAKEQANTGNTHYTFCRPRGSDGKTGWMIVEQPE